MATMTRVINPPAGGTRRRRVKVNPSHILVLNGGKKKMAVSKRATAKTKNAHRRTTQNSGSRKKATHKKRPNPFSAASHHMKRRRRRRANPVNLRGMFNTTLPIAGGVIGTDIAVNLLGSFVPMGFLGQWGPIVTRYILAWGLGTLMERFVSPANAQLIAGGGAAGAIQDASRILMSQIGGIVAPKQPVLLPNSQAQLPPGAAGIADIVNAPEGYSQLGGLGNMVFNPGMPAFT